MSIREKVVEKLIIVPTMVKRIPQGSTILYIGTNSGQTADKERRNCGGSAVVLLEGLTPQAMEKR